MKPEDFFNHEAQSTYFPGSSGSLVHNGLFLKEINRYIFNDLVLAKRVLRYIELGRVDIFKQERIFSWIDRLYTIKHRINNKDFNELFNNTMLALKDKTDSRFRNRGYRSTFNKRSACFYSGFGDQAIISSSLCTMRLIANREAYKHIGYIYGNTRPRHLVDFPAKVRVYIKNPKYADYANNYAAWYQEGFKIIRINHNLWEIIFDEYYLNLESNHLWSCDLWAKIFTGIKKYAEQLFIAEVFVMVENQFND